jgi:hypothetical protein
MGCISLLRPAGLPKGWVRRSSGAEQQLRYAANSFVALFSNAACTTALIDRLVHHSEIISIEGESYRKREAALAKEDTATRRRKKRP